MSAAKQHAKAQRRALEVRRARRAWASAPDRAKKDAIDILLGEAVMSDDWAKDTCCNGPIERQRLREDAAAMRAAVQLLKATGFRP